MERPKQQALAFLLGALLVGGVLGFSADRVFRQAELTPAQRRAQFYEDIGITADQRLRMDSILDSRNCAMDSVIKTVQPKLDSVKAASRVQMDQLLTPDQRARLEQRRKDDAARHAAERKRQKPPCGR
jgi:hypothetical protein